MITFDIISLFPEALEAYFGSSIMKRAVEKKLAAFSFYNLRDFSIDKHRVVDDRPFGGGPGMVLMVEPILLALKKIMGKDFVFQKSGALKVNPKKYRIVLFDTRGTLFTQDVAHSFLPTSRASRFTLHIILICGRYEGVDERVKQHLVTDTLSVGNFVLSGGEIPAMLVIDTITRLIPGVLGNEESIEEARTVEGYPVYTRPRSFSPKKEIAWEVPEVLFSGDFKKIEEWRRNH